MRTQSREAAFIKLICALCACIGLTTPGCASAGNADGASYKFDISGQTLPQALGNYAQISGQEIIFVKSLFEGTKPVSLKGNYTASDALDKLLKGTGLVYERSPSGAIMIRRSGEGASWNQTNRPDTLSTLAELRETQPGNHDRQSFRLAQKAQAAAGSSSTGTSSKTDCGSLSSCGNESSRDSLGEVIVTAQKREQRLIDVPSAVTAITADELVRQNQLSLREYVSQVPGLAVTDGGDGGVAIAVRGVTTGGSTNATVGVVIDDIPFGPTAAGDILGANFIPEFDPAELQRVEVLKGPQGTLYGAASIGGLLKYVTTPPSLTKSSARVQLDSAAVKSGELGYGIRGMVDMPIVQDVLGVRLSAVDRTDPGYLDDPSRGLSNTNDVHVTGIHLSSLYAPRDNVSIQLSILSQTQRRDSPSTVDTDYLFNPIVGDLKQHVLSGTGYARNKDALYSATVKVNLGRANLISLTGYGTQDNTETHEVNPNPAIAFYGADGADSSGELNDIHTRKFSQEVRLESAGESRLQWLLGGFFTNEHTDAVEEDHAVVRDTGENLGSLIKFLFPSRYKEYAAFGSLTYSFTDKFDIQGGVRYGKNKQHYNEFDTGLEIGPTPVTINQGSEDDSITYVFNPRYRFSSHLMAYARVATGYRPGGPNTAGFVTATVPGTYKPDKTKNYEVGIKGETEDRRVSFDASLFDIDWQGIQLSLNDPVTGVFYYINAGAATSKGAEFSGQIRLTQNLKFSTDLAYVDAKLDSTVGNGFTGVKGDPLPYSSKFSGNATLQQYFHVTGDWEGFAGIGTSYTDRRGGRFASTPTSIRLFYPSFTTLDLNAGVENGPWSINLFVKNATDERGVLGSRTYGSQTVTKPYRTMIITPRTIGLSVSRKF